eukprot:204344-Amphidinium_carterae.2
MRHRVTPIAIERNALWSNAANDMKVDKAFSTQKPKTMFRDMHVFCSFHHIIVPFPISFTGAAATTHIRTTWSCHCKATQAVDRVVTRHDIHFGRFLGQRESLKTYGGTNRNHLCWICSHADNVENLRSTYLASDSIAMLKQIC